MSSEEICIRVRDLGKRFEMYAQPADRLRQMILPKAQRLFRTGAREYFREFWALRDVSFDVRRGETVGIVGRNGSGKSTLLQIICGTLHPTVGEVQTTGRIAALLELGAGFNPEFTGSENVRLSGLLYGLSEEELHERYDAILEFAGIGDFIDQPIKTYSSGMMVRLAFSVAINVDPQILVIDEALSVGDELFQRKCFARIETIRDRGATVLFVSHAAGTVIDLCDRALLVDSGELVSEGQPKLIVSRYHKLLYAPVSEASAIREQIKQTSAPANVCGASAPGFQLGRSMEDADARQSETYDPGLVPASTVNFASKGALIQRPSIWTRDGKVVNGLVRGRRYCFGFNVAFSKPAYYVRFGSLIRGITGLPICGTMSAARLLDGKAEAAAGQSANVEFWFDCMLNPGIYFMNAGVFGVEQLGQEETLLHRIADAIAFRVLPITDNASTELADFNCESQVQFSG